MISPSGFAALRVAATLVHTVPGLRARLRDGDRVRAEVARADGPDPVLDAAGVTRLSPCGFRKAVVEASLLHQAGRSLALLDLASDPAIDIGVPPDGRSWPGGIYRVPLEQRWLYAFRNRHGFTDAADAAFDQLWTADDLTWDGITALSQEALAALPA